MALQIPPNFYHYQFIGSFADLSLTEFSELGCLFLLKIDPLLDHTRDHHQRCHLKKRLNPFLFYCNLNILF